MSAFYYIYVSIVGLCLGSFYNVVGLRVPKGESIITPRSHCTQCQRILGPGELVPFFSYLWLRGKCRNCGTSISPLYPVFEITTSFLFLIAPWLLGWSNELIIAWTLISLLIIICITDIHYMLIPDKILIAFTLVLLPLRLVFPLDPWWDLFVGALVGFTLLFLIALISRGGMGGGDIKLFAVLGLILGWKGVLIAFFFSTVYGTIIGGVGMIFGKVRRGKPMPFGPAIGLGTITAYFWGEALIDWYFQFFRI
ncbi:A24 family peptidase [Paenibacillus lentus]|uniref:prepilin peptidase n=1 Tax=Paenibacillus lentus TaxID=1338368 RepID=UPI003662101E